MSQDFSISRNHPYTTARWREKDPSPKQVAYAQKLGIAVQPEWSMGEVSDAIVAVTGDWY
jgi:hypothetical protein